MKMQTAPKQTRTQNQAFSFRAPDASNVLLVGDFTHWQKNPISMHKAEHDVWTATVVLPPGTYHYRFIVDGEWRDDPECTVRVPNPYGHQNMVRQVA
jgi:1,4-alpha-glucan branching enzyme